VIGSLRRRSRALPALAVLIAGMPLLASVFALLGGDSDQADGGEGARSAGGSAAESAARDAARRYLDRYVAHDGRVVRHDQGGDTVSEGQSYALLLAQVAGDREAFDRVWSWTRSHLQRPDGLLASHADPGGVIDDNPASDGDLATAWALVREDGALRREGVRMARAVLERETVAPPGPPVLAAGPWGTGQPATLNPSYWALGAFASLEAATGDARWSELTAASVSAASELARDGRLLPPDWARVDGSAVSASASPNGDPPEVQYGPDAQRLVIWMAAGCRPEGRRLAAAWWPILSDGRTGAALALRLDGEVLNGAPSPLSLLAAAAAAGAAGRPGERDRLIARAERLDAARPSYYGGAWVALGRALLTTDLLGGCALEGRAT
jgi:hypothetical protein